MKKIILKTILFILFLCPALYSQPFVGATGNFDFSLSQDKTNTGIGGGGYLSFGYDFGPLDVFLKAGYINLTGEELIVNSRDVRFGFGTSFSIDKNLISAFPKYLCIRPGASVLLNIYNSDFYPSYDAKDTDDLQKANDAAIMLETSLNLDFPELLSFKNSQFIPTVGYDLQWHFDSSGIIFSNSLSLGFRWSFLSKPSVKKNNVYIGATGSADFPFNPQEEKNYGTGGGANLYFGYNFGLMDLFIKGGYSYTQGSGLIVDSKDFKFGLGTSLYIDKNNFKFMPELIRIRPEVSILADFYNINHYSMPELQLLGLARNSRGFTPLLNTSLYCDFILPKFRNSSLVPELGYDLVWHFDKSGIILSNEISLGIKYYIHKTETAKPEKKPAVSTEGTLNVTCKSRNKYFSPDSDGKEDTAVFDITTDADGHGGIAEYEFSVFTPDSKLFYTQKGKNPGKVIEWNGKNRKGEKVFSGTVYQYVLQVSAKDGSRGMVPGLINVDLMLQKVDGGLNIIIPSINFPADSASFKGLSEAEYNQNMELLDRLAQILKEYENYSIEISGHANNVSGTEEENINELIPLSSARAQTIKNELIKRGIKAQRIECTGKGSSVPLAADPSEAWKNRRVEILLKEKK